ncbi:LysE family translocator [Chromobacterium phragmitis]|uniref:LysE family translocator n=1 Tax=Chromobacterium phragmitis TaxID=2202141 RepID=A0A344UNE6_9NEIS|nr:LysE family translocator [Chromobacterium phragmitis]AXE31411.1 LysE family translocator [Chromobacterium phragmitis]AXE36794.1 LysE family translocator [Chromobacterium phragmitis]
MNLVALVTYLLVMSITPGPNNLVLASASVNFGFSRTLPMLLGMALGLSLQLGALTLFLGAVMSLMASLQLYLAIAGCGYLLWLSWNLARAGKAGGGAAARPMGFFGGLMFNWLNPKVWLMGFNLVMVFLPTQMDPWRAAIVFALAAFFTSLPCVIVWAGSGVAIGRFLDSPLRLRAFNCSMAAMLAATAIWLLAEMMPAHSLGALMA